MAFIKQGRFADHAGPEDGSNGIETCVGIAIPREEGWFIAHIDCATMVRSKNDPVGNAVAAYVKGRLDDLLGPCVFAAGDVHVISTGRDNSTNAIREGIDRWVRESQPEAVPPIGAARHEWDGFKIGDGGVVQYLGHAANNADGAGGFSVPDLQPRGG